MIAVEGYGLGLGLIAIGMVITFFALPKGGNPARWLRWDSAVVVFPAFVLLFYSFGVAALIATYLSK
jgi:hypothetical protein